ICSDSTWRPRQLLQSSLTRQEFLPQIIDRGSGTVFATDGSRGTRRLPCQTNGGLRLTCAVGQGDGVLPGQVGEHAPAMCALTPRQGPPLGDHGGWLILVQQRKLSGWSAGFVHGEIEDRCHGASIRDGCDREGHPAFRAYPVPMPDLHDPVLPGNAPTD